MNFSMTIDRSTVSCSDAENMYIVLHHVEACFLAAGYRTETFVEYLAGHLEIEHGMAVMREKDYHAALDDARGDGRPSATEDSDYMAGLVDYGLYDEPQEPTNPGYMHGWLFGSGLAQRAHNKALALRDEEVEVWDEEDDEEDEIDEHLQAVHDKCRDETAMCRDEDIWHECKPTVVGDSDYMAGLVEFGLYDEPQHPMNSDYMDGWHFAWDVERERKEFREEQDALVGERNG